ncbi:hypothetical protein JKP88DRAFT_247775 [Tribonema minus]|uniref:Uncharacterized protein n=1 Tax=Tribonema minus TaxID=303371 RepID=A0A836CAB6_9STRA|nr:hypothetical protein JKP88DRAFT_247775 [Tribonema minus]
MFRRSMLSFCHAMLTSRRGLADTGGAAADGRTADSAHFLFPDMVRENATSFMAMVAAAGDIYFIASELATARRLQMQLDTEQELHRMDVEMLSNDVEHERALRKRDVEHERALRKREVETERELRRKEVAKERALRMKYMAIVQAQADAKINAARAEQHQYFGRCAGTDDLRLS